MSGNTALTELNCLGSNLTTLDISSNTALKSLNCCENPLTALDLSHNPMLEKLACADCPLDSIDISHNPLLIETYEKGKHRKYTMSQGGGEMRDYDTYVLDNGSGGSRELYISRETKVIVKDPANTPALKLSATRLTLGVGETSASLVAKDSGVPAKKCAFKSSKETIATVNASGKVTGVKIGSCTITVTPEGGSAVKVKVSVKNAPGKVTLNKSKATLAVGKTLNLKASLPKDTASKITWKSSNAKVATVSDKGVVTAVKAGTATITASTFNGKSASTDISVPSNLKKPLNLSVSLKKDYDNDLCDVTVSCSAVDHADGYEFRAKGEKWSQDKTAAKGPSASFTIRKGEITTYSVRAFTLNKDKKVYSKWASVKKGHHSSGRNEAIRFLRRKPGERRQLDVRAFKACRQVSRLGNRLPL